MVAAVLFLTAAPRVDAHTLAHPKHVRFTVEGDTLNFSVSYQLDPGPSTLRARAAFDRDTDGWLSAAEQSSLRAFLLRRAVAHAQLQIKGAPSPWPPALALTKPDRAKLLHAERPTNDPRALELVASYQIPLAPMVAFDVRLTDRPPDHRPIPVEVIVGRAWTWTDGRLGDRSVRRGELPLLKRAQALHLRFVRRP